MKINFLKTHKIGAITFVLVALIGILVTVQQIGRIQDNRQHAASDVTLQLVSASNKLQVGQKFDTSLVLDNRAGKQINSFDITLAYDPQYIESIQILPAPRFHFIKSDTNQDLGTIRIAGLVDGNNVNGDYSSLRSSKVAIITFATKRITPMTTISFANAEIAALDDTKNVLGTIVGSKFTIVDSQITPTYGMTPAPSKPYPSVYPTIMPSGYPTPTSTNPSQCKTGADSLSNDTKGCQVGLYSRATVGCYDGYQRTIDLGYCMTKEVLNREIEKACSGRTSCSPKYNPTPTPMAVASCDINRNKVISKADYDKLLNCVKQNKGYNCKYADLNSDGKIDALDVNIYLRSCGNLITPTPTPKVSNR